MKQVVERLWQLQTAMSELADKERNLNEMPDPFRELHEEYEGASGEIASLQEKLEEIGKERRRVERELQDHQEVLKKYEGQLMQVKNQHQYAAALKEIDETRKSVRELEEGLLSRMTEAEETQKVLDQRKAEHAPLEERYTAEHEAWQHSLSDLRSDVVRIHERVAGIESAIPPALLREFHRIFTHRQGVAVAKVVEGSCSACRVRVRPQAEQQLKRGELIHCEGCHRISYLETAES